MIKRINKFVLGCCLFLTVPFVTTRVVTAQVVTVQNATAQNATAQNATAQHFVGSEDCAACHQQAYASWQQSHHRHAMAQAAAGSVVGDFNNASFDYFGTTSRFLTREGKYFVVTDNSKGELEEFEVAYTFGVYPLQQYLVKFPDGRLQALGISWDSRPQGEGGQRWYHLYPDEKITAGDPLHWTGAFQNWNSRCASCHSTDLAKNYVQATDSYDTKWSEISVGCEACHGAGSQHLAWAAGNTALANKGLLTDINKLWEPVAGQVQIPATAATHMSGQLQVCAGCHSRRSELQQRDIAADFADNYSLTPLLEGLYHDDGQILDEVFEAGSFMQSKMHQNQVSCSNCHEPHSNQLRIEGNGLCLQCHEPQTFQAEQHFFHKSESSGAQCVNCHMPARTYMGVDTRRDHSFRVPDPLASLESGVPNACTQCHAGKTDQWAADFISARTGRTEPRYQHATVLAAARRGESAVTPALRALADDPDKPIMLRAIALLESGQFPDLEHLGLVLAGLKSPDPLLRMNAVAAVTLPDPVLRLQYLEPLLADPAKSVRMAVARQLDSLPLAQVPPTLRSQFSKLLAEYEASLLFNADMPESLSDLGLFHAARGNLPAAEQALLQARKLAPAYLPGLLNLADLYRAQGRDEQGEEVLTAALAEYPESGDVHFALGLLYVRTDRKPAAVALLQRASELAPTTAQYVYVYAVALAEVGQRDAALAVLGAAAQQFPDDAQIRDAITAFSATAKP
jgi:predicted CXXCH cytochrome family protein